MSIALLRNYSSPFLTAFTLVVVSLQANGQRDTDIDNSLNQAIAVNMKGPGITAAIVRDGNILYTANSGLANLQQEKEIDSSTTFWIASVTKQFTAAAIYILAKEDKLILNRSIRDYLPDLPPMYNKVTVDHLVHHTSGIRDGFVLTALSKRPPSEYTNDNVIHYLKSSTAFNFEPGSKFEYNNSGYVLLATIIERVSGKSYADFIKENIFVQLNMSHTYVSPKFPINSFQAEGYMQNSDGTFHPYHFEGNSYGSTGIVTAIPDLAKWAIFIQKPESIPSLARIVPELLKTGILNNGKPIAYAGGLEKFQYRGQTVYEHFGADEGFKADILYFPDSKISVIGLTNNNDLYDLSERLFKLSDLVHGISPNQPFNSKWNNSPDQPSWYYNQMEPRLLKVFVNGNEARVSSTTGGYAAPHLISNDTLRTVGPLPNQYLLKDKYIQSIDPYYQNQIRLAKIQPDTGKSDLEKYVGEYFSKEINTGYKLKIGANGLQFEFFPGLTFDLFRITNTDFVFDYQGPNFLQFTKNGLLFSREGIHRLVMDKN